MSRTRTPSHLRSVLALLFAGVLGSSSTALAQPQNLGFEGGTEDGAPVGWSTTGPNAVVVVDAEDGTEFDLYDASNLNLTVSPFRGDLMLRIGQPEVPGDNNNNQADGTTDVFQAFTASGSELLISTRIFSGEFRRDRDSVVIHLVALSGDGPSFSVTDGSKPLSDNVPFSIALPGQSCNATPCTLELDAGRNGDVFDSDWKKLRLSGLTSGNQYEIHYKLVTGGGSSHPSHVYFDDVNRPPTACIEYNPGLQAGTVLAEGDQLALTSCSSDPDGDPIQANWTADGDLLDPYSVFGEPMFMASLPDDGDSSFEICLTVSDGAAESQSCVSPTVVNVAPKVGAPDVQAQLGKRVPILCKYADPSLLDVPTVTITLASGENPVPLPAVPARGQSTDDAKHDYENAPPWQTGYVELAWFVDPAVLADGDVLTGQCSVSDGTDAGVAPFRVVVTADPEAGREGNDDLTHPTIFPAGSGSPENQAGLTLSAELVSDGDAADVYQLVKPDGTPLQVNDWSRLTLRPEGTDVDVIVVGGADARNLFGNGVFSSGSFQNFGWQPFGYQNFGWQPFGYQNFGWQPFGWQPFGWQPFGWQPFGNETFGWQPFGWQPFGYQNFGWQPFPIEDSLLPDLAIHQLSLAMFAGVGQGHTISAEDVTPGDLGAFGIGSGQAIEGANLFTVALSANTGEEQEEILFRVPRADVPYYAIAVRHLNSPPGTYTVTHEFTEERKLKDVLTAEACEVPPVVPPASDPEVGPPTTTVAVIHAPPAGTSPLSLCLGQEERRRAIYGMTMEEHAQWVADLAPFLDHPAVACLWISLPSMDLEVADRCDPDLLKSTAHDASRLVVQELAAHPTIQNVIVFGNENIVPHCSVRGTEAVGDERHATDELFTLSGSRIFSHFYVGHNLTDSCYVDSEPQFGLGDDFYLPDEGKAVGRMGESPEQILEQATFWVARNLETTVENTLTTGYSFFKPYAGLVQQELASTGATSDTLIDDLWTTSDLQCKWLEGPPSGPLCEATAPAPDLTALTAHMASFGLISAFDYLFNNPAALFLSAELPQRPPGINYGPGCHMGLMVPNEDLPPEAYRRFPLVDWTEVAHGVLKTGYGVGNDENPFVADTGLFLEFTERLAEAIGNGSSIEIGQALVTAERNFLARQWPTVDPYTAKAVMTTVIMGMPPQVRLVPSAGGAAALQAISRSLATPSVNGVTTPEGTFTLEIRDGGGSTVTTHAIETEVVPDGTIHKLDGFASAAAGHALLGQVFPQENAPQVPGQPIRALLLRGEGSDGLPGIYEDRVDYDPVLSDMDVEWEAGLSLGDEPKGCVGSFSPGLWGGVNDLDGKETLIVGGATFRCDLAEELRGIDDTRGTLRFLRKASYEVRRATESTVADANPAEVKDLRLIGNATTGEVTVKTCAVDASGIALVSVLEFEPDDPSTPGGAGEIKEYTLTDPGPCVDELDWPDIVVPDALDSFLRVAYCGFDGWCKVKTNKGELLRVAAIVIATSFVNVGDVTTIVIRIDADQSEIPQDAQLLIDLGDGSDPFFVPLFNPDGSLSDLVTVEPDGTLTVRVDHTFTGPGPFTVQVELQGSTITGFASKTLPTCSDPLADTDFASGDIVTCSIQADGTNLTLSVGLAADADPANVKYRVRFPLTGDQVQFTDSKCNKTFGGPPCQASASGSSVTWLIRAGAIWNGTDDLPLNFSTQAGVPGSPGEGLPDFAPDEGNFVIVR